MVTQIHSNPDIFKIDVFLPNSPLKNLNCYVVPTPEETLIIDTGFNRPECLQALREGLEELKVDLTRSVLFLTHLHSDHVGLTEYLAEAGARVLMSRVDYDYLYIREYHNGWSWMEDRFEREGLPHELVELQRSVNPAHAFAPTKLFKADTLADGERLTIGPLTFRCVLTPGHTPGHMCLYMEQEKILFCGDHILFNISPNITMWQYVKDSLGNYRDSLRKVRALDIKLALPAHRQNDMDVYERIDQLQRHHDIRLNQMISIIQADPGLNACQIGARMSWSMRGKNWDEFPIQQKWFAIGETIAHLDYLVLRGTILRRETREGIHYYLP